MSIEAMNWADYLAPIPLDADGTPNAPCAAVLSKLANHAGPDGRDAFPSIKRLTMTTKLKERTIQKALRRLEADKVILPGDPDVVAAKIKRADRRPNGWDLNMNLIRTDFDEDELAMVESVFPGIRYRIAAAKDAQQAADQGEHNGVHQVHPENDTEESAEDATQSGVHQVHPGTFEQTNGVHQVRERGAPGAPEHKEEPNRKTDPPLTSFGAPPGGGDADGSADGSGDASPKGKTGQRGKRLPQDWMPSPELLTWAAEHCPNFGTADIEHYTDEFRDYWHAESGSKATKLNWDLTWQNRMRTVYRREQQKAARTAGPALDHALAAQAAETVEKWWTWWEQRGPIMGATRDDLLRLLVEALDAKATIQQIQTALKACDRPCPPRWMLSQALLGRPVGAAPRPSKQDERREWTVQMFMRAAAKEAAGNMTTTAEDVIAGSLRAAVDHTQQQAATGSSAPASGGFVDEFGLFDKAPAQQNTIPASSENADEDPYGLFERPTGKVITGQAVA